MHYNIKDRRETSSDRCITKYYCLFRFEVCHYLPDRVHDFRISDIFNGTQTNTSDTNRKQNTHRKWVLRFWSRQ